MKATDSNKDTGLSGAVEEEKVNCDSGKYGVCPSSLGAAYTVFQFLFYPCAVLLGTAATTVIDNRHHALKHVTAYIGWFFLIRSIQGAPSPLSLVTCSILILSGSYVEGAVSRERTIAIFVGSSMLVWLPQISNYQPSKGSLHDFLKSIGPIERLCLAIGQLVFGVSFIVPKALKVITDGPKVHSDFFASISVGRTVLILAVPSLFVVSFRLKKPILFVHDRLAFPLLIASVVPPLSVVGSLAFAESHESAIIHPNPPALQIFAVAWTLTVEVVVICFFWTNCCSWVWGGAELLNTKPTLWDTVATFGHQALVGWDNICPNTVRALPGEPGHYVTLLKFREDNRVIEHIISDLDSAFLLWAYRIVSTFSFAIEQLLAIMVFSAGTVTSTILSSFLAYIGWVMIGHYMNNGRYSSWIVNGFWLAAWGSPFGGRLCMERFWTITCFCNLLLCLPLFVSKDLVDLGRTPYILDGDSTQLVLIGGPIYLVAEYSWLSLISFQALAIALGCSGSYSPEHCSTFVLIAIGVIAVIPLYFCADDAIVGVPCGMGALGTILSVGMRYLSTNGPVSRVIPPMDSPTYQVSAAAITLCVEVAVVVGYSWCRRRRHPEEYRYSWWPTPSQLESVKGDV